MKIFQNKELNFSLTFPDVFYIAFVCFSFTGLCLLLWIVSQVSSQDPTVPTLTPELPTDRTGVLTSPSGPGTSIANLETTPVLPPSGLKIPVVLPFSGNISKAPVNSGDLFGSVGYTREDEATTSTGNRKQFASLHGIPDDQIIYATTLTNLHFHIQPSLTEYTKSHSLVQSELSPLPTHSQNILTSFSGQNGDIPSSSFVPPEGVSASTADVLTNNFTQSSGHLQPSTTLSEAFSTLPLQIFTSSPSVPKGGATFNFGLQENRTVTHMFNQSDVVSLSFTGMSLLKDGLDPSPSNQNLLTTIFHSDLPTLHPKRDNSTESDGSLTIETSTGDGMNYTTVLPSGGLGVPATLGITLGCLAAVLTVCKYTLTHLIQRTLI